MIRYGLRVLCTLSLSSSLSLAQTNADAEDVRIEINNLSDLGLESEGIKVFPRNQPIALLLHPRWKNPVQIRDALKRGFLLPGEDNADGRFQGFESSEIERCIDDANSPLIWKRLQDTAKEFVEVGLGNRPEQGDSLSDLVNRSTLNRAPLITFDPLFRFRVEKGRRHLEVYLRVAVYFLEIEERIDRSRRVVKRLELIFEDRALGRVDTGDPDLRERNPHWAAKAAMIDALRSKIAVSLLKNGLLEGGLVRRPETLLDSRRAKRGVPPRRTSR